MTSNSRPAHTFHGRAPGFFSSGDRTHFACKLITELGANFQHSLFIRLAGRWRQRVLIVVSVYMLQWCILHHLLAFSNVDGDSVYLHEQSYIPSSRLPSSNAFVVSGFVSMSAAISAVGIYWIATSLSSTSWRM